jgi:hypothetical protein
MPGHRRRAAFDHFQLFDHALSQREWHQKGVKLYALGSPFDLLRRKIQRPWSLPNACFGILLRNFALNHLRYTPKNI